MIFKIFTLAFLVYEIYKITHLENYIKLCNSSFEKVSCCSFEYDKHKVKGDIEIFMHALICLIYTGYCIVLLFTPFYFIGICFVGLITIPNIFKKVLHSNVNKYKIYTICDTSFSIVLLLYILFI